MHLHLRGSCIINYNILFFSLAAKTETVFKGLAKFWPLKTQ